MQIVYHLGAHCTDEERLLKCLLRNRDALLQQGISIPGPARYRNLLRDTAIHLKGQPAPPEMQDTVLGEILDGETPGRMVLSWENFLSYPQWVLKDTLYPAAAERVRAFANIFPDHQVEFHIALRNPAGFLPALFARQRGKSYEEFTAGIDIFALRWSEVIDRIRRDNPDVPLTVWCDEDTPLIWPEVLRGVGGYAAETRIDGVDDLLASLLGQAGLERLKSYVAGRPNVDRQQLHRIVEVFLDKFVQPGANEVDVDLPGWDQITIDDLTEIYDEDVALVAARDDITFLTP